MRPRICMIVLAALIALPVAHAGDRTYGSSPNPGILKTKVKPDDAGVWINGDYVGHADRFSGPGENLFLPPGEYEVRFTMVYYKDHVEKVTIKAGEKTVIRQKLSPSDEKRPTGPFGKVKIHPTALNAAVLVNGRHIGYADQINKIAQTLLLEPGTHEIELQYEGYKPWRQTVEIQAGQRIELEPQMTPE